MSSSQKRKIARRNGAKAAGAKSPEGIKRSSANALKHGLTAKAHVLSTESQEDFDYLRQQYINRFQPQDTIELDLVDDMVGARWRLRRITTIQTATLDFQMGRYKLINDDLAKGMGPLTHQAMAFGRTVMVDKSMEVMLRYETTYSRMYDRALKALERLQAQREEPKEPEESETSEELRNDATETENTPEVTETIDQKGQTEPENPKTEPYHPETAPEAIR